MEHPLVSVIVISYNQAQFIAENLDSILAQTYPNIELIVADDASQDNSVEVFEAWLAKNNYPVVFKNYHQQNTGLATTLNECIAKATGKYLKLIAADDFLHPKSIEKCVLKLESLGEDYGMVFTDFLPIDENGVPTDFHFDYKHCDFFSADGSLKKDQLLKYNCIIAPSVLVKKTVIEQTGAYRRDLILEDHHRWLKINQQWKIAFLPEVLVYYRVLSTSVTATKHPQMVLEDLYLKIIFDRRKDAKTFKERLKWTKRRFKVLKRLVRSYLKYRFPLETLNWYFIKQTATLEFATKDDGKNR